MMVFLYRLTLLAVLISGSVYAHAEESSIPLPSGETFTFERFPSNGQRLLLWFAAERGLEPTEALAAQQLAAKGIEVWQFDLVNALFLPQVPRSLDSIPRADMQAIFNRATATGRQITVYATSRSTVPVLNTLAGTQVSRICVLLMHPNFYSHADALSGADYLSFGDLGKLDVLVIQPRRSAATPWVGEQIAALKANSANAGLLMLDKLREGFWRRDDATPFEMEQADHLAESMIEWMGSSLCRHD